METDLGVLVKGPYYPQSIGTFVGKTIKSGLEC